MLSLYPKCTGVYLNSILSIKEVEGGEGGRNED